MGHADVLEDRDVTFAILRKCGVPPYFRPQGRYLNAIESEFMWLHMSPGRVCKEADGLFSFQIRGPHSGSNRMTYSLEQARSLVLGRYHQHQLRGMRTKALEVS